MTTMKKFFKKLKKLRLKTHKDDKTKPPRILLQESSSQSRQTLSQEALVPSQLSLTPVSQSDFKQPASETQELLSIELDLRPDANVQLEPDSKWKEVFKTYTSLLPTKSSLWWQAKNQVENDPKWKDISEKYASALSSIAEFDSLTYAVHAVTAPLEELRKNNESDPWIIPLPGGRRIPFDRVLLKIAESVKVLATLGSSLAELDPTHGAAIAFGLVRVFAQAVIDGEDVRKLVADQEPIIHIVSHYAVIEQIYLHTKESFIKGARLRKGLVDLYVEVLHYQLRAYQYYRDGKMKHAIQSFFPSELADLIKDVEKKKQAADDLVKEAVARRSRDDCERLQDMLRNIEEPVIKMGLQLQQWRTEDKRKDMLKWVSKILPEGRDTRFDKSRPLSGTCGWLLAEPAYENWREEPRSGLFWLKGKMGSGKTHLVTAVIEDIQSRFSDEDMEPVLFYYCDRANTNTEADGAAIINAILRQMLSEEPELPKSLIDK
ncbi:hypothetical protein K449DRAFT_265475 [Hypoxylon sp. EC38]|nr:hypothetical protein K449DRAFT_265475 [Hypoxylon sp. EC38]